MYSYAQTGYGYVNQFVNDFNRRMNTTIENRTAKAVIGSLCQGLLAGAAVKLIVGGVTLPQVGLTAVALTLLFIYVVNPLVIKVAEKLTVDPQSKFWQAYRTIYVPVIKAGIAYAVAPHLGVSKAALAGAVLLAGFLPMIHHNINRYLELN